MVGPRSLTNAAVTARRKHVQSSHPAKYRAELKDAKTHGAIKVGCSWQEGGARQLKSRYAERMFEIGKIAGRASATLSRNAIAVKIMQLQSTTDHQLTVLMKHKNHPTHRSGVQNKLQTLMDATCAAIAFKQLRCRMGCYKIATDKKWAKPMSAFMANVLKSDLYADGVELKGGASQWSLYPRQTPKEPSK